MEPSPGDGSGRGGRKAAVWTGEGVELHEPAEQVGAVGGGSGGDIINPYFE